MAIFEKNGNYHRKVVSTKIEIVFFFRKIEVGLT